MPSNNPLLKAIRKGTQDSQALGALFNRYGNTKHPNTEILKAYRAAGRGLRDILKRGEVPAAAREVMGTLKDVVRRESYAILRDAALGGAKSAIEQVEIYGGVVPSSLPTAQVDERVAAASAVVLARLEAQEAAIIAALALEADETTVLGDQSRMGLLRPSDVIGAAAYWTAETWWSMFGHVAQDISAQEFKKLAVAGLDERTTDCCLQVHGQIQPFDGQFRLTGTPRFADRLDWPPFHHWCRTSGVLYLPKYDLGIVDLMRSGARLVLDERAVGINRERHPADAFAG